MIFLNSHAISATENKNKKQKDKTEIKKEK